MNPHPVAQFLTKMGYRRISRAYRLVARLDREDWLMVMAATHFDDTDWVYNTGPDYYRRCLSSDKLQINDWDILMDIPLGHFERTSGYGEMTANNKAKLSHLLSSGVIKRC